ncbi:MAG TPA: DUF3606 domain-containing protein [Candidatus Aquabacterium excrementipullorum]|nr:DUF3606 domain-containing protein [Candidatus Aquabacterium excrementipullorum]
MSDQQTRPSANARIDVHDAFQLVCWARHFKVSQSRIRAAVDTVGDNAAQVASHLSGLGQNVLAQALPRWAI